MNKRLGSIGTKTRDCLRELHSLTVSKSERFLYSEGAAGTLNCPWDGLKTYSFQRMNPREAVSSQAVPGKYFRPHLVNRRRFQPACCFTAGKSDARRNLLQPVTEFTSVQRMQTKLTPISSNGCVLHFSNISRLRKLSLCSFT